MKTGEMSEDYPYENVPGIRILGKRMMNVKGTEIVAHLSA
jgi:hypothetical protein